MNIDAISPIQLQTPIKETFMTEKAAPCFASWLSDQVNTTNNQLLAADTALQQLASGNGANLHQSMLALEEAKLSFQYVEQIRNRLMAAYQDILREQI